jgi:hypothetical protein
MKFGLIAVCMTLAACGSVSHKTDSAELKSPENMPDVVISRSDALKSRPNWIQEANPFRIENDKVVSQGFAQIPSEGNLNAAYRICFNNSKSAIASAIEQKLEYTFQQSSEGTELDSTTAQFIGAEMSSLTTNSMRNSGQYYEKVATTLDSGERKSYYRVFCTTQIPIQDFRRHLHAAIQKAEGKGSISQDFQQKVDSQWNQFVNAPVGSESKRESASAE